MIHPECDDCTHVEKQQYPLKVMFWIEDTAGARSLDSRELANQLADALPREWWQDRNMAEWGTISIMPLNEEGNLVPRE
jgi:hypothetical protein